MARLSRSAILSLAALSVFTPNTTQTPEAYADAQMKGRGDQYSRGPFGTTGRKLEAAQSVNGVAFVTLWRVNLTEAEKADVKGYQIVVYDLAGNVLSASPMDDSAPKGKNKGYTVYGETCAAIAERDDLIIAAIQGVHDKAVARVDELAALLAKLTPAPVAEAESEAAATA